MEAFHLSTAKKEKKEKAGLRVGVHLHISLFEAKNKT
jgi:hypothetical protein